MDSKIEDLMEYKQTIENKRDLDLDKISVDDLTLEELENVAELYKKEIQQINRNIAMLEQENESLKNELY